MGDHYTEAGQTTSFAEASIGSVDDANRTFGGKLKDGSIPVVLFPGRNCLKPFMTVPEGCYALVQRFGADLNYPKKGTAVWPSGFHWAAPWKRVSHLVTKQNIVFDTPVKGCKTADNVTVTIDVCLSLRIMGDEGKGEDPDLVRIFVYKLGPRGLAQQLRDAQDEAVRALARSVDHEQVYGLRSAETHGQTTVIAEDGDPTTQETGNVTDAMKNSLNDQFNKLGVQITDVAITNVRLPMNFTKQMQEKTVYSSIIAEQKMKQENDMQMLKFKEEIDTADQKKKEEQEAELAVGTRICAEAQKELDTVKAETNKMVSELTEDMKTAVREITTEAQLIVKTVNMEKVAITEGVNAKGRAEAEMLEAERDAFITRKHAEGKLFSAKIDASVKKVVAEAEGDAASKLRAKRAFENQQKQLRVYSELARNDNVVISGNSGDSLLAEMLVAQRQSQIMLNVDASKGRRK